MDQVRFSEHLLRYFADVHPVQTWGETAFFYNPRRQLPRGVYFATIKSQDGDNDRGSSLVGNPATRQYFPDSYRDDQTRHAGMAEEATVGVLR